MKIAPEIYLLCRCIERKYAEILFDDGILHFSYLKKWIDEAKKGNVGKVCWERHLEGQSPYLMTDLNQSASATSHQVGKKGS